MRESPRQIYHQPQGSSGLVVLLLVAIVGLTTVLCVIIVKRRQSNQAAGQAAEIPASTASTPIQKPPRQTARLKKRARQSPKNARTLSVTTDSTPVFQSNSANSSTVTSLKKGDQVRSGGIEIIDPRGSLTLVEGQGQSGFVPSEMLERKTPTQ
jgi:hypothetical protein